MPTEKYTRDWFVRRAFQSVKKLDEGRWDYSDSLLIYVSSGADVYEALQQADTPYHRMVTKPEHEYLSAVAKKVAEMLPNDFDYIDLGPGTEHKEQFLFDALRAQGKAFTYLPVDISDHFLDVAETHASTQGIAVKRMKASFEELPELLGPALRPRFVSLGLTFSNYEPQVILELLRAIAGTNGFAFINAQIRDRVDMDALQEVYQEDAVKTFDEKIRLLGLDPETDATPRWIDPGFRGWCTVKTPSAELERLGVKAGDELLIFRSLRYTKAALEKELEGLEATLIDTGSSFIACVIRA